MGSPAKSHKSTASGTPSGRSQIANKIVKDALAPKAKGATADEIVLLADEAAADLLERDGVITAAKVEEV